ncbi:MAG: hypothetical protein KGL40_08250 [Rhodocyclaceae bacterium]|nr:hypothetical protein [Rhodocyclaceae bacterium]
MKKASALGFSAILLAAIGYGAALHARDSQATALVERAPMTVSHSAEAEDLDLVGVIGDTMVDGCTSNDARCSKAWKDLGELAGKDRL